MPFASLFSSRMWRDYNYTHEPGGPTTSSTILSTTICTPRTAYDVRSPPASRRRHLEDFKDFTTTGAKVHRKRRRLTPKPRGVRPRNFVYESPTSRGTTPNRHPRPHDPPTPRRIASRGVRDEPPPPSTLQVSRTHNS